MTHETPRDPLREALRSLPRARPADDFTERVVERIDGGHRGRRSPPTLRWAAAAAVAMLALAAAFGLPGSPFRESGEKAEARGREVRVAALEAEHRRLAAELDEIRRLAADLREPAPVLYLGGDEEVDLVVDLDRLLREHSPGAGATPATYRGRGSY